MKSQEIRQQFLNYFSQLDHIILPSSSLIPGNDPTLLFTNAGMVQFKNVFLGEELPPYSRAATIQRCVRAGGKHNDLENVGYTKRHHTFFEMLGNFSFGDYFKKEAIVYAWKFLTEVMNLPAEKLWVTVYKEDSESEAIWLKDIKVNAKQLIRCGEKDNFWSMGEIGPCGPCTEIFYDHGPTIAGGPPGSAEQEGDRYVEIWNIVFMQYNRDEKGVLHELPKPCVDTGMGLERIAAVLQGVHDNYDTDLFIPLLSAVAKIIHEEDVKQPSIRVIADHIRSASFLIADGVIPANEGRGYVLRRIIRRAIRHGYKLGQRDAFFFRLVEPLVNIMGGAYPELSEAAITIEQVLSQEELQFSHTLENGMKIFEQAVSRIEGNEIPGKVVFQLYDTFGFPVDLTADIARERGLTLDHAGFEEAMAIQRQQSQLAHQFKTKSTKHLPITLMTTFTGYDAFEDEATVKMLFKNDEPVLALNENDEGVVVLDKTPFYAESGGQVGDKGLINFSSGHFQVTDTQKQSLAYLHHGKILMGSLQVGDKVQAKVDESRKDIMLNHSATHLLHEALRRVLGQHVVQKGSLVAVSRLRFDFAHNKPLTVDEIAQVEALVNDQIRMNQVSHVEETTLDEAKQSGALALFGEKYGAKVRVISMGDFSTEVCGGTHVHAAGEIGFFKIISETACAAGIRRIEAVTGQQALKWVQSNDALLQKIMAIFKVSREELLGKIDQNLQEQRYLNKQLESLKQENAKQQTSSLIQQAITVKDIKVLAVTLDIDREGLRTSLDRFKQKLGKAIIVLAAVIEDKAHVVVGVSKECLPLFTAPEVLNYVVKQIDGKGGGRDDMAQGGGERIENLPQALSSVIPWIKGKMVN